MNIYQHITRAVAQQGDQLAFVAAGKKGRDSRLSYVQFGARVERLCAGLSDCGVNQGDRVILLMPMQIELYLCMAAIMRIGAVAGIVSIKPISPNTQR